MGDRYYNNGHVEKENEDEMGAAGIQGLRCCFSRVQFHHLENNQSKDQTYVTPNYNSGQGQLIKLINGNVITGKTDDTQVRTQAVTNLISGAVVLLGSQYRQWNGQQNISEYHRYCDFDHKNLSDYGGMLKEIANSYISIHSLAEKNA